MRTVRRTDTEIRAIIESKEDRRSEKSSKSDDHVSSPRRCRLCAIPNNDMVDIFSSSDDTEGDILQMIRHCLRIIVKETDTLPKQVCRVCLEELQLCYQFNQIVAEAESQLLALDRQALIKPDVKEKNHQPSPGTVRCGSLVHPEIESTRLCRETQNAKPLITEKEGLTIAETLQSRPDLTRSSVVLVATKTQPRSLRSKKDGRRNPSDDGHNDANPSVDDSNSGKELSDVDSQSTSESGGSKVTRSGSRTYTKNLLRTRREKETEDAKIKAEMSLENNTSDPHRRVNDLPTANPVIEAPVDIGKRRYNCSECMKTYSTKSSLVAHRRLHTSQRPHTCQYCEKKFIWISCRDVHQQRVHSEERPFKCSFCEKSVKSSDSMMDHAFIHREHKDSTAYRCSVCDKAFKYKSGVERHMVMHTDEKRWQCDYCKNRFAFKFNLKSHLSRCKERTDICEQCYKCNLCPKSFKYKNSLSRHHRLHTGKDLYSCKYCIKNFTSRSHRDSHLRVHTDNRLYKCATCDKSFKNYSNLNRHTVIHTHNRPQSQCE